MSGTNSANAPKLPAELKISLAAGTALAFAAATWLGSALAQQAGFLAHRAQISAAAPGLEL